MVVWVGIGGVYISKINDADAAPTESLQIIEFQDGHRISNRVWMGPGAPRLRCPHALPSGGNGVPNRSEKVQLP